MNLVYNVLFPLFFSLNLGMEREREELGVWVKLRF